MIVVHDLEHLAQADDATSTTAGEGSLDLGVCVVKNGKKSEQRHGATDSYFARKSNPVIILALLAHIETCLSHC